jgi:glycosyltransferase involved in cell wall biosynthesis
MAAKTPVIATATTGACEILEDGVTGLLVPIGDATALAQALLRLVRDPNLRARLAANAYACVTARHGEEVFFRRVVRVLSGVVRQPARLGV